MLQMNQIDQIKDLQRQGYGPKEIAARLGLDRKTTAKYMGTEDYSGGIPSRKATPSKLDPWKAEIEQWLEEDRRMRFKQRHTAKRIHDRLLAEHPGEYGCSYSILQRYVKGLKEERRQVSGFLELIWAPDEAQADFGEADVIEAGEKRMVKFLVLSFPSSNAAYVQAFGGETAECVCQGLKDIFERVGGVPSRIVFDNASGVGRRVRDRVTLSELFLRFKCHYGFSVSFCNPDSGHEKGNVENKVGYIRRNFFVPIPTVPSLPEWNRELLGISERDFPRPHYKKGQTIRELFDADRKALGPLPAKPFPVERLERIRTDGYGKFCIDDRHWYSSAPELALRSVMVGIGAHAITVYDDSGESLAVHERAYGNGRSDSIDYRTSLDQLLRKPGAWRNCALRAAISDSARETLDGLDRNDLHRVLGSLAKNAEAFGFELAIDSLEEALRLGKIDSFSSQALAARMAFDGLAGAPDSGPDLGAYDRAFMTTKDDSL
jgi:Transposase and inactivated derivatives